jgi:hypothetical protein
VINRKGQVEAVRRFQLVGSWLQKTLPSIIAKKS